MYKYDTHTHTSEVSPCGKVEASEIVRLYKQEGYNGIVITDHYYDGFFNRCLSSSWEGKAKEYLAGYRSALEEGNKIGLKVLLGIELRFQDSPNDYLVYGIDEKLLFDYPELYKSNLKEFRKFANEKNLLIYQAHPYRKGSSPTDDPTLLDGVEVYNGHPRHDSHNDLAYAFGVKNKLKSISGSDFHQTPDLARGGIITKEEVTTIMDLVEILKDDTRFSLIKS